MYQGLFGKGELQALYVGRRGVMGVGLKITGLQVKSPALPTMLTPASMAEALEQGT